jgi:hypothetical protein
MLLVTIILLLLLWRLLRVFQVGLRRWPGDSRDDRARRSDLIFPRRVALTLSGSI